MALNARRTQSDTGKAIAVHEGKRTIASLAWTGLATLPGDSSWRGCIAPLDVPTGPETLAVIGSLWFDPAACTGEAAQLLLENLIDDLRSSGIEIALLATPAHLVSHAEILGFRRLGNIFQESEGPRLAMALVIGDWAHLARVRSPLLPAAQKHPPNFELPDWFDRRLREYHRPAGTRAQRAEVFLQGLAKGWQSHSAPLLDDLGEDNLERLRAFAQAVTAAPGQVLLRKGTGESDLYLVLEGAVEVSEVRRGGREVLATLGAGQIFGEGGFFARTPRSADVTAIVPTRLLMLAPAAFDLLGRQHPEAAIQVLRALGRTLCLRVYAGIAD
jgi:hypothetical protein